MCAYHATQRSGSVKQGMKSSMIAVIATFLSTTLLFSCIYAITYLFFQRANELVAPSSIPGVSPFVNYVASYQNVVFLIAVWLLVPVIVGLLIALLTALISRRTSPRPTFVAAD